MISHPLPWWQHGVIYQIYPRSFKDSNGDGIGDLQGIITQFDYLTWLGVDAMWICPFYPSPMADFGYDITDHCNIDSIFGDLKTFDVLVEQAHQRSLKVIITEQGSLTCQLFSSRSTRAALLNFSMENNTNVYCSLQP